MKIINVMVTTINGRITHGSDPDIKKWTSEEDGQHYRQMLDAASLVVMGSTTYEMAKAGMKHTDKKLRVILTHQPERYANEEIPRQLEFSNKNPQELVSGLENKGYDEMLLVGGGEINRLFYGAGLVTDLYLTIEPKIFGTGKIVIGEGDFFVNAKLASLKQLNERGSLLLHYIIEK